MCAGIVGENGRDGRNMAGREADRGPQDWGPDWGGSHMLDGYVPNPFGPSFSRWCPDVSARSAHVAPGRTSMMPELLEGFSVARAVDAHWGFMPAE